MIRKSDTAVRREVLVERRQRLRRALDRVRSEVAGQRAAVADRAPCQWLDCTMDAALDRQSTRYAATMMATELEMVEHALQRLETSDARADALCGLCGGRIEVERLALLPYTSVCSSCARAEPGG